MRKSTTALAAGAVIALAAAGVIRFVVVPSVAQVPANLDLTGQYVGTASLLNAPALASGDTAHVFLSNLPVTGTQHVKVTSTSGKTAVMSDDITVLGPDGSKLLTSSHVYAVDRISMDAATPPSGSKADAHQGLAVGFPLTPEKTNYAFWDATTRTTSSAIFTKTVTQNGRSAYVYTIHSVGAVTDPTTLATLPKDLPKAALAALAPGLPAAQQTQLTAALPQLPDTIPLSYVSTTDTTATVDQATGWLLNITQSQTVLANMNLATGATPLAPVLSLNLHATDASVAKNVKDASHAAFLLSLIKTTVPVALLIVAVLLAALAYWAVRRHRTSALAEVAVRTTDESTTV